MRKPLGQLFLSLALSIVGALVLMFLLPPLGMEPSAGTKIEAGVLLTIVILVVMYARALCNLLLLTVVLNRSGWSSRRGNRKVVQLDQRIWFYYARNGDDVFVHYRSIRGRDRYLLREGAVVTYVLGRSGKGPQAEDVDLA